MTEAGPDTKLDHLYRARVFQTEDQLKKAICWPDRHLGSPPPSTARGGRMNAHGISVFYGATNDQVAIAEIRPPVGSWVAVAKFVIIRSLRLLDLTALEDVHEQGSIFDPSLKWRLERVAFLQSLGQRMARPVMPNDEALNYLPTQAVSDFLATMNEPRLDGIIFPSAQTKEGCNVVLFHHAARVALMVLPKDTKVTASTGFLTEDGWETEYSVSEQMPPARSATVPTDPDDEFPASFLSYLAEPLRWNDDFREEALQIDVESITVHDVNWVEINTTPHAVNRCRSEEN